MENERIGKLISKIRKEKGMTQKDLADKLNVTDRAVSKWERGICCPDISLLKDLSSILGISISKLICGEEVSDESINKTIEYTQKNIKQRIIKYLNIVLISIMIILIIFVVLNILKVEFRYHKKYKYSVDYEARIKAEEDSNLKQYEEIKNKVDLILNNQGKYSDDDYKRITNYIDNIKKVLNLNEFEYFKKEYYTYDDLEKLSKTYNSYNNYDDRFIDYSVDNAIDVYYLLIKYDINKANNITNCSWMIDNHWGIKNIITSLNTDFSLYYYNVPKELANNIYFSLDNRYDLYYLVLNDIIEVGDISENI